MNEMAIEHNFDCYVLFRYLGDKIEGELGRKYRDAAIKIANFLRAPVQGGGAYLIEEGRFIRGIRNVERFLRGERGDDVVDYTVATDVQAWGASIVAIYEDDFKGLDPRTFVNYVEKNCEVEVEFNGKKVRGFDFFNIKVIKEELRKLKEGEDALEYDLYMPFAKNPDRLRKELSDTKNKIKAIEKTWRKKAMIAVEWINYMVTAYLHAADRAEEEGDKETAGYYRAQAEFYKNEVDKLIIEVNGEFGLVYANLSDIQKADDPNDKTPKNSNRAISSSATITRTILDIKTRDGRFFDPLRIEVRNKVDLFKKVEEIDQKPVEIEKQKPENK
ncbi:hypothetical protein KKH26_03250, partial [Patescibacteria group bacterium]|nr:hypothetical protein [Patescibacteria group bacterium]